MTRSRMKSRFRQRRARSSPARIPVSITVTTGVRLRKETEDGKVVDDTRLETTEHAPSEVIRVRSEEAAR